MEGLKLIEWRCFVESTSDEIAKASIPILKDIFERTQPDDGHGLEHALTVLNHGKEALKVVRMNMGKKRAREILIACLIHDVGDSKFSKEPVGYWERYCLRKLFEETSVLDYIKEHKGYDYSIMVDNVLQMINLVSCSKWGDKRDGHLPSYWYIPRYADRLEAVGPIGVERAVIYAQRLKRPLHNDSTPRAYSQKGLNDIATPLRYEEYTTGKRKSLTTLDHFYDKCLHIDVPEWMDNSYLSEQMERRKIYMIGWIIGYWLGVEFLETTRIDKDS